MTLRKEMKKIIRSSDYLGFYSTDKHLEKKPTDQICSLIKERLENLPEQLSEGDTGWLCVDKQWIDKIITELSGGNK